MVFQESWRWHTAVWCCATVTLVSACADEASPDERATLDFLGIHQSELLGGAPPEDLAEFENWFTYTQQHEIVECMGDSGFDYAPVLSYSSPDSFADFTSQEFAEAHGFGVVDAVLGANDEPESASDPNARNPHRNSPEYSTALERCAIQAAEEVNRQTELTRLRALDHEIVAAIAADAEVVAAAEAWRECAASAGIHAVSRRDLIETFLDEALTAEPSRLDEIRAAEINAAVQTYGCSTEFDRVWRDRGAVVGPMVAGTAWGE